MYNINPLFLRHRWCHTVIVQLVIMCEAVLLALWASALYRTPTKVTAETVIDA